MVMTTTTITVTSTTTSIPTVTNMITTTDILTPTSTALWRNTYVLGVNLGGMDPGEAASAVSAALPERLSLRRAAAAAVGAVAWIPDK